MTTLTDIHMPHMGSVENIVLTTWLKVPGDRVTQDEPLCEVSTDKVDTEVPSPESGVLVECLVGPEDEVAPGAVIARFAPPDAGESDVAQALDARPAADVTPVAAKPASTDAVAEGNGNVGMPADASLVLKAGLLDRVAESPADRLPHRGAAVRGTPLVRKIAREHGLDLATIVGTGPGGRVTRKDVEAAVAANGAGTTQAEPQPAAAQAVTAAEPVASPSGLPPGYESVAHEEVPLTPQRRAIARNLVESVSTAPQLTAQIDVDMSVLGKVRAAVNAERQGRGQRKLSYLPFVARALCAVVAEHPDINATFTDSHLLRWHQVNLGIAVDAPQGLVVPVVRDAERLSLAGLADAISDVTTRIVERKAWAEDVRGGTITISNSGSVGGVIATPILTRPQVASLGVPAIIRQPVAVTTLDGEEYVAIRPVARLGLTFDHRAFDGAAALRALQSLQHKLENWSIEAYQ